MDTPAYLPPPGSGSFERPPPFVRAPPPGLAAPPPASKASRPLDDLHEELSRISSQQAALRTQIEQSESNLSAQHTVSLRQAEQSGPVVLKKCRWEHLALLAGDTGIDMDELETVIHPIVASCTKDSIAAGKSWIFQRATDHEHNKLIAHYLAYRVTQMDAPFSTQLHLMYLMNDVLHHCVRKHAEELKQAFEAVAVEMFCGAAASAGPDQRPKLDKLIRLWEDKRIFSPSTLHKMKDTEASWQTFQMELRETYARAVEAASLAVMETYENYRRQHQNFVNHANASIQSFEKQKIQIEGQIKEAEDGEGPAHRRDGPPWSAPPPVSDHGAHEPVADEAGGGRGAARSDRRSRWDTSSRAAGSGADPGAALPPSGPPQNEEGGHPQGPPPMWRPPPVSPSTQRPNGPPGGGGMRGGPPVPFRPPPALGGPPAGAGYGNGPPAGAGYGNGPPPAGGPPFNQAYPRPPQGGGPPAFGTLPPEELYHQPPPVQNQAQSQPPPPQPAVIDPDDPSLNPTLPYYDLPAGLMVPMIRLDDSGYKPLDPRQIRLPPPTPPSERLLNALELFYAPPSHERPRDPEGWEVIGLYEWSRGKTAALRQKVEALESGERERSPTASPEPFSQISTPPRSAADAGEPVKDEVDQNPPPRKRYRSKSRSPASRAARSRSRTRSRSRGSTPDRGPRRRGRSRSASPGGDYSMPSYLTRRSPSPSSARGGRRSSPRGRRPAGSGKRSASPEASYSGFGAGPAEAQAVEQRLDSSNKGHQMMQRMGWKSGSGLGSSESGIVEPISGGEVRDKQDKFMGVGVRSDPFEAFRKAKSGSFYTRMKERDTGKKKKS